MWRIRTIAALSITIMMTILFARATAAQAGADQERSHTFDLGLAWGRYDPEAERLEDDVVYGLRLGVRSPREGRTLGLEAAVDRFRTTDLETASEVELTFFDLSAKYYPTDARDRFRGFLFGGPGWAWVDRKRPADDGGNGEELEDSFSLHFGAGLDFRITDRWSLQPELRVRWREQDGFDFEKGGFGAAVALKYFFDRGPRLKRPPLPVTLTKVIPTVDGTAVYEPHVARVAGDNPTYRIRLRAWFHNAGSTDLTLKEVSVLPRLRFDVFQQPKPMTEVRKQKFLGDEETEVALPEIWGLRAPPQSLEVTLTFEGPHLPVSAMIPLDGRETSYAFPSRAEDLEENLYWVTRDEWHDAAGGRQAFAYDFNAIRLDPQEKEWIRNSGSNNSDYDIWGNPVRAIASGTILKCINDHPDNPDPPRKLPQCKDVSNQECRSEVGGNNLVILHENGENAKYSHFMKGSIPPDIYPKCKSQPVRVEEGQLLGLVGNSGNSGGPHLHLVVRRDDIVVPRDDISLPLLFSTGYAIDRSRLLTPDANLPWALLDGKGLPKNMAIGPPGCGNGILEDGEKCDASDLGSETCGTLGAGGGNLRCKANCRGFDRSACDFPNCSGGPGDPGCSCKRLLTGCRIGDDGCFPDGPGGEDLYCPDNFGDNGAVCALAKVQRQGRQKRVPVCRTCPTVPVDTVVGILAGYGCPCHTDKDCKPKDEGSGRQVNLACWGSSNDGWAAGPGVCLPQVDAGGFPRGTGDEAEFERTRWLCKSNCAALSSRNPTGAKIVCEFDPDFDHALCIDVDGCEGPSGSCEAKGGRCDEGPQCVDECDKDNNAANGNTDCERWGYPSGYLCTEWGHQRCVPSSCARLSTQPDQDWCLQFVGGDP